MSCKSDVILVCGYVCELSAVCTDRSLQKACAACSCCDHGLLICNGGQNEDEEGEAEGGEGGVTVDWHLKRGTSVGRNRDPGMNTTVA